MKDDVWVSREMVQALIDLALTGDKACSGRMDDEEVMALRAAAVAIGMDPMEATPQHFKCKYRGHHEFDPWYVRPYSVGRIRSEEIRRCRDCCFFEHSTLEPSTNSADMKNE